jgi:hypothetical protein
MMKFVEQNLIKKSDAQVGRVNTFHTLLTIRKGPLKFKQNLYERTLKIFKFQNSGCVVLFFDHEILSKKATRFILR